MSTTIEAPNQITELELIISDTNGLTIQDDSLREITEILRPIAESIPAAVAFANTVEVSNAAQANAASDRREQIIADHKKALEAINGFGDGLIDRLFKAHRRWCAFRNLFSGLDESAKKIKRSVLDWQEAEERKAAAEQRRLQAEADEKARKERERLEKEAAALKTPEKKEERLEAAASVVAPVITVNRPVVAAVKSQKRWKVKRYNMDLMGIPEAVQGYITVETGRLERAKAANTMLNVPGVEFFQQSV